MRRAELEHLVRAACELTGDDEIIVIGSQAIHASIPEDKLPGPTTLSNEADLALRGWVWFAAADSVCGDGSPFDAESADESASVVGEVGEAVGAPA